MTVVRLCLPRGGRSAGEGRHNLDGDGCPCVHSLAGVRVHTRVHAHGLAPIPRLLTLSGILPAGVSKSCKQLQLYSAVSLDAVWVVESP